MRRVLLSVLLLVPLASEAQMYKCTDERGRTQYTDEPRPGCKPAAIRASPPISGEVRGRKEDFATEDAQLRRRQIEREASATRERQATEQRCARLRQEHGVLVSGVRIGSVKPSGERVFMDDATRDQRLARVREELRSCP